VAFNEETRNGEWGSSVYCKIKRPGIPPGAVFTNVFMRCQAFSFDRINRIDRMKRINRIKTNFISYPVNPINPVNPVQKRPSPPPTRQREFTNFLVPTHTCLPGTINVN
jgi:hypothetical protein